MLRFMNSLSKLFSLICLTNEIQYLSCYINSEEVCNEHINIHMTQIQNIKKKGKL